MKILCIYHANCADGFTAAWVVKEKFGKNNVEFHKGVHGDAPPDVKGRDVIIVDFSYKRPVLEQMGKDARSVLILDHHKSAMLDLEGFPCPIVVNGGHLWEDHLTDVVSGGIDGTDPKLPRVLFDMDRSGAMITWDFFFPNEVAPIFIKYVQDRDLWKFTLLNSREFTAGLFSYEYTFENWDYIENNVGNIIDEGHAILRKHNKDIAELIEANKGRRMNIGEFNVPVINVPYMFGSDTCHILAKGEPFAAYYYDLGDDRMFGLRSEEGGEDVSVIAASYGGGGHKHAAGFKLTYFNKNVRI